MSDGNSGICKHCGEQIFYETDDMITCGGAFEVWYSIDGQKRRMTCPGWKDLFGGTTHEPITD